MRLVIIASIVFCFGISAPSETSKLFDADLSSLEGKFFFHEYSGDTDSERLDRLDQLVFGHVRQGSAEKRMTSLLLAVPDIEAKSVQPTATSIQPGAAPLESEKPQLDTTPSPAPAADESNDYYPTVTALEEQIAHKTQQLLPVQQRLAALETIAFGKPSTLKDLSKRVDLLKQYVRRKNGGNEEYLTSSNAVAWPSADTGLNAEVSSMETEVFGKTYGRDSLSSRLTRLERSVLPQQPLQTFTPIETRVNTLMAALNTRKAGSFGWSNGATASLPSSSFYPGQTFNSTGYTDQQQPDIATARNAQRPKGHPLLRRLGVVLGEVGGMAARSMMYGGYGYY